MKCPKCHHSWKPSRRIKVSLPISETSPGTVFPQRCWQCERNLAPGDPVFASTWAPASFCVECVTSAGKLNARDLFRAHVELDAAPHEQAPIPAETVSVGEGA